MSPLHLQLSYLLFISFAISSSFPFITAQACNKADMHALLRIKKSLGNPPELSSWDPKVAAGCCNDWSGVGCGADGRITSLSVMGADVSGPIPSSISNLSALTSIDFFLLANLVGPIPDTITQLKSLEHLSISSTAVSGTIPTFLCAMSSLTSLDLSENQLKGEIPSCLLSRAKRSPATLSLRDNQLTGEIPRSFANVEFDLINLSGNRLTGDAAFLFGVKKSTLSLVRLSRNQLEFDLSSVQFPPSLRQLNLSHNKIRGRIPQQISTLKDLELLDVSYNALCGPIPNLPKPSRELEVQFEHNKCLCGAPLSPCRRSLRN